MSLQICGLISQILAQLQNCACLEDASMPQGKNSSWKAEKKKTKTSSSEILAATLMLEKQSLKFDSHQFNGVWETPQFFHGIQKAMFRNETHVSRVRAELEWTCFIYQSLKPCLHTTKVIYHQFNCFQEKTKNSILFRGR